jgi:hypothetical protein
VLPLEDNDHRNTDGTLVVLLLFLKSDRVSLEPKDDVAYTTPCNEKNKHTEKRIIKVTVNVPNLVKYIPEIFTKYLPLEYINALNTNLIEKYLEYTT